MKFRMIPVGVVVVTLGFFACQNGSGPSAGNIRFNPPSTEFRDRLHLTAPVTQEQAMAIAAEAAGGTATSASSETEHGELLYEVQVEAAAGNKEVEVRASDGAVVEIEAADND